MRTSREIALAIGAFLIATTVATACESESPATPNGTDVDAGQGADAPVIPEPPTDASADAAAMDAGIDGSPKPPKPLFPRSLPASGVCSGDGWCFVNPLPLPNRMFGAWGSSETDIWFVGEDAIVHYDGLTFRGIAGLGGRTFSAVAGSGPNDAWALADDNLLVRWNGTTWSESTIASNFKLKGIWSRAVDDAWIVGASGTIRHWDGTSWNTTPSGTVDDLSGVYGFAANDVWAVGGGSIRHWNGTAWTDPPSPPPQGTTFATVWGASPTDIWFAGSHFVHFNGSEWTSQVASSAPVVSLWGKRAASSSSSYYYDSNSSSWKALSIAFGPGLWGSGSNYYVANGSLLTVSSMMKYNASNEPTELVTSAAIDGALQTVWAGSANDVWIASKTSVYRGDGTTANWTKQSWGATTATIKAITGRSPTDVWIAADSGIASHYDGMSFTPYSIASGAVSPVTSSAANDAWILVGQNAFHWNGSDWSDKGKVANVASHAIWGFGESDAWGCETIPSGVIVHLSGATWTPSNVLPMRIVSVWGSAPSSVSAVDTKGQIARWNGQSWTALASTHPDPKANLYAVFWQNADDIWAVHGPVLGGRVSHFGGGAWEDETIGGTSTLTGITRASSGELWAVGSIDAFANIPVIARKAP